MHKRTIVPTGEIFRVGKIVCIGRNYVDHIRELGNEMPDAPVLFMKPASSLVAAGGMIEIPANSRDCHHEAELAVLVGRTLRRAQVGDTLAAVAGYGVAIDLTLRDVQSRLKEKGLPWEMAKGFDTACPLSDFVPAAAVADPQNLQILLSVNGELRQNASTALMIRPVAQLLAEISATFTLEPGDVVLTGTPAGVSRIVSGDNLVAEIPGVARLAVRVA